jgi:hypothetical protein
MDTRDPVNRNISLCRPNDPPGNDYCTGPALNAFFSPAHVFHDLACLLTSELPSPDYLTVHSHRGASLSDRGRWVWYLEEGCISKLVQRRLALRAVDPEAFRT